jgi:hypothetical protein
MRKPCGWFENGEECGKPSVSSMGDWPLCAEHSDQIIREAVEFADSDECTACGGSGQFRPDADREELIDCDFCNGTGKRAE